MSGAHESDAFPGAGSSGWDFTAYWAYLVGPLVGAMIAVVFERILRGSPTKAGANAAQGILGPGDMAGL